MDSGTTVASALEHHDRRSHIERINDWNNPAAILDVGEFTLPAPTETHSTEE